MGLLGRLWPHPSPSPVPETAPIGALIERLTVLSPSLKLVPRYRERLRPALAQSIAYATESVARLPPAREASAANWLADPYIHAFFAAPDDIAPVLSRSPALHEWFDAHLLARETYAVLAMTMTERHAFGVEQAGDTVHSDVAQRTLSFDGHLVRVCDETEAGLRGQIVERVVEQLALEALAQIGAEESRRDALVQERALLKTRLQLMTRHGVGTHAMLGASVAADAAPRLGLEAALEANARALDALGLKTDALAHELDLLCDVLSDPAQHANVEMKRVRLNAMNVVVGAGDAGDAGDSAEIVFPLARLPANELGERAFSLVRFARADLVPLEVVLDRDSRFAI